RLRSIEQDATTFRAEFKQASLDERAFRFPDSLAVAVSRDERFSIAQRVAQRAERLGLTDVRVRFATADSTGADSTERPAAPELGSSRAVGAVFSLRAGRRGDLAAFLSLVNQLAPSVALQRLEAERGAAGDVDYHLALAVFESTADTIRPPVGGDVVQQVAQ